MALSRTNLVLFTLLVFMAGIIAGTLHTGSEEQKVFIYSKTATKVLFDERAAVMRLPAVTRNNTGVFAEVGVVAKPGTGKIFITLSNVLSTSDVGQSARMAALLASNHTGIDVDKTDFFFELSADATLLEGPSAGAAFTVAAVAALLNRSVNPEVMMTGTINHDGTIGPAGKILEKSKAAKDGGATLMLVPIGASTEVNYTSEDICKVWGRTEYCFPELKTEVIDISEVSGIRVVEVSNLDEAVGFALL
ncbi:MAG: hypothetical protein KAJ91_01335 [Candidatus Aenigmarchaeota archaeon]|nr:hypothetical protein [Candidatus Aenigmarchaeota archaeon]